MNKNNEDFLGGSSLAYPAGGSWCRWWGPTRLWSMSATANRRSHPLIAQRLAEKYQPDHVAWDDDHGRSGRGVPARARTGRG